MRPRSVNSRGDSTNILVSLIVAGIITQVTAILIARMIGVEDFGIYSIIVSTQLALGIVATFGMRITMAKLVSQHLSHNLGLTRSYVRLGLLIVTIATSICVICYIGLSDTISTQLYDNEAIAELIPFSALVVAATAYHATLFGVVQGEQRIPSMIVLQVAPPALILVLVILLAPSWSIVGILVAFFLGKAVVSLLMFLRVRGTYFSRGHHAPVRRQTIIMDVFHLSIPSMISSSIVAPILWLGSTELTVLEGFGAMGLLAGSLFFFNAIQILPQAVVIPLVPRISRLAVEPPDVVDLVSTSAMKDVMILLFPATLICCLLAEEIIVLIFGQDFTAGGVVMAYLSVASFFAAIASILGGVTAGLGKMWHALGSNVVWGISFIVLTFSLVPRLGLEGIGISFALSYLIHMVTYMGIAFRWCGIHLENVRGPMLFAVCWLTLCLVLYVEGAAQHSSLVKVALMGVGLSAFMIFWRIEFREYIGRIVRILK